MTDLLCAGAHIWARVGDSWVRGQVVDQREGTVCLRAEDGAQLEAPVASCCLQNTDKSDVEVRRRPRTKLRLHGPPLMLEHLSPLPPCMASPLPVQDMTTLTHLHEPGVLHNLDVRYARSDIYTNTGSILIAVNPFKPVPRLFGGDVMEAYRASSTTSAGAGQQQQQQAGRSPHVYAVACAAYQQMLRDGAGQAILVGREHGAL